MTYIHTYTRAQAVPLVAPGTKIPSFNTGLRDVEMGINAKSDAEVLCTHRHDLDENGGEVLEFAVYPDSSERDAHEAVCDCAGMYASVYVLSPSSPHAA